MANNAVTQTSLLCSMPSLGKKCDQEYYKEGGVRVCGDVVLHYFWCSFAVMFI